jgi:hypothetical protein
MTVTATAKRCRREVELDKRLRPRVHEKRVSRQDIEEKIVSAVGSASPTPSGASVGVMGGVIGAMSGLRSPSLSRSGSRSEPTRGANVLSVVAAYVSPAP